MIYLSHTTTPQQVLIPKNIPTSAGVVFVLISTITLNKVYEVTTADANTYKGYYTIGVELPNTIAEGEYSYLLRATNGNTLSQGLAIVGDYDVEHTEYNKTIEYKQYE